MTKVLIPLKVKIISTNVILLLLTIVLLVQFASSLFTEDKSATIYEATLNSSLSYSERVKGFLEQSSSSLELLKDFSIREKIEADSLKSIFSRNPYLISFTGWKKEKNGKKRFNLYLENDLYLRQHGLTAKSFLEEDKRGSNDLALGYSLNSQNSERPELIYKAETAEAVIVARLSLDSLLKELNSETQFQSFLIVGENVLSPTKKNSGDLKNRLSDFLKSKGDLSGQVIKMETLKKNYLVSEQRVNQGISTVSLIEENSIFRASEFLRTQSFFFSLLIFSLTVIFGVLISKGITKGLSRLHEASLAYAKGHFEDDFEVHSRDEIGSLAVTFKNMGKEILRYVEEMKDKARLEKEIEVARLVQESFIPQVNRSHQKLKLSSLVQSASECGGDWWGLIEIDATWVLVVADATGHGVPAALLTATAGGCLHNIEYGLKENPQKEIFPSQILKELNFSIARMGGKINMTAFALVFDTKTGTGRFSNASHNPPFWIKEGLKIKEFSKNDLNPLMGEIGPRLGESLDSSYQDSEIQLSEGDFLFLFSDGLVEQSNSEGKQWGNRNFHKALINLLNKHSGVSLLPHLPKELLDEVQEFSGKPWEDDVTLLTLGFTSEEFEQNQMGIKSNLIGDQILCSEGIENGEIFSELLEKHSLRGVFQKPEDSIIYEKIKKNGLSMEILDWPIQQKEVLPLKGNVDLESKLQEGVEKLSFDGFFDSPKAPFSIVVRELATNALYHQNEETSRLERTSELNLPEELSITVTLGVGEKGLVVFVEDQSGRLSYEALTKNLARAYKEKSPRKDGSSGGAGLGLLMIFENANRVFVEVQPGKTTKVMAIIDKEKRYKNYKSKNTDFIFVERDS